jgi:hypothetical protein
VKTTTAPHASFLLTTLGRGLVTAFVATGFLAGCDAPDDASDRALELDDEELEDLDDDELTDEEMDELVAEQDAQGADEADESREAPTVTQTVADVLAELPESLRMEMPSGEDLDRPVPVTADSMIIDSDGNGVIDPTDQLVSVSDPVAIGEMACATQALTDPIDGDQVAMTVAPNCGYAWDGSTSPNSSYDTAGCPHQYVTEITGTSGEPMSAYWEWHGGGLTADNCDLAHASLTFYGATWNWFTGTTWTKLGSTSVHGVWIDGPLFDFCSWQYDAGKGPLPSLPNGHSYFKVRTAAQATGFILKVPVEGGIWHGDGPC